MRLTGLIVLLFPLLVGSADAEEVLRVCADPNNLPFSNRAKQGFENRIALLLAKDLDRSLIYEWHAHRRGFLKNTLLAGKCDLVVGITTGIDRIETTRPYYRSAYVFVTRPSSRLTLNSFDAPQLRTLRVGVQVIGDDYANTPPVHALARRGIVAIQGYRVVGDYQTPNPPASIIHAVTQGEIDVAIAWGPMAGYFAARVPGGLQIHTISSAEDAMLPLAYDIGLGLRREDKELKQRLEASLSRNRHAIRAILRQYNVPLVASLP